MSNIIDDYLSPLKVTGGDEGSLGLIFSSFNSRGKEQRQ
jgi:hypothetical protein